METLLASYEAPDGALEDALVLVELGEEAEDTSICEEVETAFEDIEQQLGKLEINRMLGGPRSIRSICSPPGPPTSTENRRTFWIFCAIC